MSRRRQLSDEERALWTGFARSITPLRRAQELAQPSTTAAEAAPATPRPAARREAPPQKKSPPLAPLGRRLRQRVARGREPIDARLDLHGLTQREAHAALLRFLRRAQADDARIALIVTGKGTGRGSAARAMPQPSAACSGDRCRCGFRCRSSALLSSASRTPMPVTAGKARFMSDCGAGDRKEVD